MRALVRILSIAVASGSTVLPVHAQQSCFEHRAVCDAACTPAHVARYHFGSLRRCTANCEPRAQECLRTGVWVDLERRSSGGPEAAPPF